MTLDRTEFGRFMLRGVIAVVDEQVDRLLQLRNQGDGVSALNAGDARVWLRDEEAGVGVDIHGGQDAIPVAQQGCSDDKGTQSLIGTRLDNVIGLKCPNDCIPAS